MIVRSAPSAAASARGVEGGGEGGAVLGDLEEQRVGVVAGELAGEGGEARPASAAARVSSTVLAQRPGLAVLEHAEPRGDAGLEREAAEQRLAEGVDGLDLQAAGGLERAGEEGAGAGELRRRDRVGGLAERVRGRRASARVVEHRPGCRGCGTAGSASRRRRPWCR